MGRLIVADPFYGLEEIASEHDIVLLDSSACSFHFIPGINPHESRMYINKWGGYLLDARNLAYMRALEYLVRKRRNIGLSKSIYDEFRTGTESFRGSEKAKMLTESLATTFSSHLFVLNPNEERKRKALESMYRNLIQGLNLTSADSELVATAFVLAEKRGVALISNDRGVLRFHRKLKRKYFNENSQGERTMQFEAFTLIGDEKILPQYTLADNIAYLS